jgi:hypothetical protein
MPSNKGAVIRFRIIDELMKERVKGWTKPELLNQVNKRLNLRHHLPPISSSTLRYDLYDLEVEFKAPIERLKNGRSFYYRYTEEDYQLFPISDEIRAYKQEVQLLKEEVEFWKSKYAASVLNNK